MSNISSTTPLPAAPAPARCQPLNWRYPLAAGNCQSAASSQAYFQASSQANDGFYPLGANGFWHGGIHSSAAPGGLLTPVSPLVSMANGEVVAYRLDTRYPEVDYPDSRKALYSTSWKNFRQQQANTTAPAVAFTEVFSNAALDNLELAQDQNGVPWSQITVGMGAGNTTTSWA